VWVAPGLGLVLLMLLFPALLALRPPVPLLKKQIRAE
jgi:hypothetical protein